MTVKRALILLLLVNFTTRADDPAPQPTPVVASAFADAPATIPAGSRLVILGDRAKFRLMVDVTGKPIDGVPYIDPKTRQSSLRYKAILPNDTMFTVQGSACIVSQPVPGLTYKFVQIAIGDDPTSQDWSFTETTVLPSTPNPTPQPDPTVVVPPSPVGPTPVVPTPTTTVVGNMRVLLLYESTQNITRDQYNTWASPTIRAYLNSKCLKNTSGDPEWRYWDKDVNLTYVTPEWQDTMAKAKADGQAMPKFVVFAGNTLVASKTITTEADALVFLQSKGGK